MQVRIRRRPSDPRTGVSADPRPNRGNFPLAYLLMGSPGLLANVPTSRREHAIFVTRDGVECFEVFGLSGFQAARFHRSDPAMDTIVPLSHTPASLAPVPRRTHN